MIEYLNELTPSYDVLVTNQVAVIGCRFTHIKFTSAIIYFAIVLLYDYNHTYKTTWKQNKTIQCRRLNKMTVGHFGRQNELEDPAVSVYVLSIIMIIIIMIIIIIIIIIYYSLVTFGGRG